MTSKNDDEDIGRLVNLAGKIGNAKDKDVPVILLELQGILDGVQAGTLVLQEIKAKIWELELLKILLVHIQQDANKIRGSWETVDKLVKILCTCSTGYEPNDATFRSSFLPAVADTILNMACKLQAKFAKTSSVLEDTRKKLLDHMFSIVESLTSLFGTYEFISVHVMESPMMQEFLMREDVTMAPIAMGIVQSANRMNSKVMDRLSEDTIQIYLDELIYKLTSSNNTNVASAATRTLNIICDMWPQCIQLLCRYKGLKPLLNKWQGSGFERELRKLMRILEAGSAAQAERMKLDSAASIIQAMWKSWYTRVKLKKADKAFTKFQRSFRVKKASEETRRIEQAAISELQHIMLMKRKKAMRELHQKRLNTLQILPAHLVDRHLVAEQNTMATRIQARYRGFRVRRQIFDKRSDTRRVRAAVIQRQIRKWLERVRLRKKEPPRWQRPPGLTDERRVELMSKINEWREDHTVQTEGEDKRRDLHERVQGMLRRHFISSKTTRKNQQHREALLARLEVDSSLMLNTPNLAEATEDDIANYTCHSVPIATKARYNHNQELRLLRQPWWRKLGDEYQDQKLDEELDWKVF